MITFDRTENGNTENIEAAVALAEINHAMMGGKREVRTMSAGGDHYTIEYKDGRKVTLVKTVKVDAPEPAEEANEWGTAHSGFTAHRFNKDDRALCNRSIRPNTYTLDHKDYRDRTFFASSSAMRICPRCDAK